MEVTNQMSDDAATPPAYHSTTGSRSSAWRAVVSLAALVGLLALSSFAPARATDPSGRCEDGQYTETQLVDGTNNLGAPLWVGVETFAPEDPGVGVCWGTGAPGQPKTLGGYTYTYFLSPSPDHIAPRVGNASDDTSAVKAPASVDGEPHFTATRGPNGELNLSFSFEGNACTGPAVCYPPAPNDANIGTTGVFTGSIQQTPTNTGGTSASWRLTSLCVKIDGATVAGSCGDGPGDAGATTTGTDPVTSQTATPGPCVLGSVCAPSYNYLGTTGNQLATIYVPGLGQIPVFGVHTCVYTRDASTSCPA